MAGAEPSKNKVKGQTLRSGPRQMGGELQTSYFLSTGNRLSI